MGSHTPRPHKKTPLESGAFFQEEGEDHGEDKKEDGDDESILGAITSASEEGIPHFKGKEVGREGVSAHLES